MSAHLKTRLVFGVPQRTIGTNRRSLTGRKNVANKSVQFESSLERDFLVLCNFDPTVKRVVEQPLKLQYRRPDGTSTKYTLDFLVEYEDGRQILFEVKYRDELHTEWAALRPRFKVAVKFAREHGLRFKIVTEKEIRQGAYLANVKFLRGYRDDPVCPDTEARILAALKAETTTTPDVLLAKLFPDLQQRMQAITSFWRLVAVFSIHVDLQNPLSMATPIYWQEEKGP